jgi:hypothetical protein
MTGSADGQESVSGGGTAGCPIPSTCVMSMARGRTSASCFTRAHGFDSGHPPYKSTQDSDALFRRVRNTKFVVTQSHRQRMKVEHVIFIIAWKFIDIIVCVNNVVEFGRVRYRYGCVSFSKRRAACPCDFKSILHLPSDLGYQRPKSVGKSGHFAAGFSFSCAIEIVMRRHVKRARAR